MRKIFILLFCLMASSLAYAGGRGGHSTTWDKNLFGGTGWVCFGVSATGCSQAFDATCAGGATADATAWNNFYSYAASQSPTWVNLYIRPGSVCGAVFGAWSGNIRFWGYGASVATLNQMGGLAYTDADSSCATTCSLIQTVAANACSLTIVGNADGSHYASGDYIQVGDTGMGHNSDNPMTLFNSEWTTVTSVSGSVINISPCLRNSYSSTLPAVGDAFQGGPATIWKLVSTWHSIVEYYGLTILDGQSAINARSSLFVDVVWNFPPSTANTPAPSSPGDVTIVFSYMPSMEIDKNIGNLTIDHSTMRNVFVQSAGNRNVNVSNSTVQSWQGTNTGQKFTNTTIGSLQVGPTNAPGGVLTFDQVTVGAAQGNNGGCSAAAVDTSVLSYSSGVFSITRAGARNNGIYQVFAPGQTYYFGETDGTNDSSPHTQFDVLTMTQDATNTFINTGNWKQGGSPISTPATLPTPTCNSHACFRYVAYQLTLLISRFYSGPSFAACVVP